MVERLHFITTAKAALLTTRFEHRLVKSNMTFIRASKREIQEHLLQRRDDVHYPPSQGNALSLLLEIDPRLVKSNMPFIRASKREIQEHLLRRRDDVHYPPSQGNANKDNVQLSGATPEGETGLADSKTLMKQQARDRAVEQKRLIDLQAEVQKRLIDLQLESAIANIDGNNAEKTAT
jgi:hypothetical protein